MEFFCRSTSQKSEWAKSIWINASIKSENEGRPDEKNINQDRKEPNESERIWMQTRKIKHPMTDLKRLKTKTMRKKTGFVCFRLNTIVYFDDVTDIKITLFLSLRFGKRSKSSNEIKYFRKSEDNIEKLVVTSRIRTDEQDEFRLVCSDFGEKREKSTMTRIFVLLSFDLRSEFYMRSSEK